MMAGRNGTARRARMPVRRAQAAALVLSDKVASAKRNVRATYDAAQTTDRNSNIWANARGTSADAEATPSVRAIIRNRARLEMRSNNYLRGIVKTLAKYLVGRCPQLQLLADDSDSNAAKEARFTAWAKAVKLGRKLRMAVDNRVVSGEVFLVFKTNPKIKNRIKLDIVVVECDRVVAQYDKIRGERKDGTSYYDGITYDEAGNPVAYDILKAHPGGTGSVAGFMRYDEVPAANVVHMFTQDRPGQRRGISEVAGSLELISQHRRWRGSMLAAAEASADVALALTSKSADAAAIDIDPMDEIELGRGSALTMPRGWGLEQVKSEQPPTTHESFSREILNECARGVNMPLNIALANSAGYNYASGRLDHQQFFKAIEVEQEDLGSDVLDPIFERFDQEDRLLEDDRTAPAGSEAHSWRYDGHEHVDPQKEANAQLMRLKSKTTNLAIEYGRQGRDWETEVRQIGREKKLLDELHLSIDDVVPAKNERDDRDQD